MKICRLSGDTNYAQSDIMIVGGGNGSSARDPGSGRDARRKEIGMAKVIGTAALMPRDSHKSFYGKAVVRTYDDGTAVLRSYATDVIRRNADGSLTRLWGGWSATTGRHVAAFCGINKAAWDKMPVGD